MIDSTQDGDALKRAMRLFQSEDYCEALGALREPLDRDSGQAWQLSGIIHWELGEIPAATSALERASLLVPLSPLAQCRLAECYLDARRKEVARVMFLHLATLDLLTLSLCESVAKGLVRCGEDEQALAFSMSGLMRFRVSHRLFFITSDVMRRLGYENDEILPFAYQAHRLRPENLSYRIHFAQHLNVARRPSQAAHLLDCVNIEEVESLASLQRLQMLFNQLNDDASEERCRIRLQQIGYEIESRPRPPRDEF